MRFTTDELGDIEGRIATAGERALNLEQDVFNALAERSPRPKPSSRRLAAALADLDCTAGLAEVAREQNYVRPDLDGGRLFEIRGGRHPVVEQALKAERRGPFIDNDCVLGRARRGAKPPGFDETAEGRIWLVTGPNMAGKSTFLRQNALIVVMAQMGSFVPAERARIGLVDRLFSRVGASDDLARGRSTFMVEMVETAGILNQATARSLVILDEIGRGTATFDGLSIAWATVEFLHEVCGCRTLFATHYHEMTALAGKLAGALERHDRGQGMARRHRLPAQGEGRAPRTGRTGSRWRSSPACRRPSSHARARCCGCSRPRRPRRRVRPPLDDLPLFAAARPKGFAPAAGRRRQSMPRCRASIPTS